jgi:hypothetical protein
MKSRSLIALIAMLATFLPGIPPAEAATWTLIYQTTSTQRDSNQNAVYTAGYGAGGAAQLAAAGQNFTQIRWRMEMTLSGTLYYVDAYFDKWSGATLTDLQFPDYTNLLNMQKNVSNLVVASNYTGVKTGTYALGRIEVWPYNYTQGTTGINPAGSASVFDFDDSAAPGQLGHGTFQLHNLTDTQTVLAWNRSRYGDTAELGFGPCKVGANPCTNPDWTLETGLSPSIFKFQVFIGTATASASNLSLSAPVIATFRTSSTITANLGVAGSDGKVTFYQNGKRIAGCINIQSISLVATCNWKPTNKGISTLSATLSPASSGFLPATSNTVQGNVVARASLR